MTKELEPCPFCPDGGKPYVFTEVDTYGTHDGCISYRGSVGCEKCGMGIEMFHLDGDIPEEWIEDADEEVPAGFLKDLIRRWNTRYKRTCHFFASFDRDIWGDDGAKRMLDEYLAPPQPATLSTMDLPDCYECSACAWQARQAPPAWMKHCPNCGAEVVDE